MRLSDKNIEAILADSQNCVRAGHGDVQLLCHEIQERRADELVEIQRQADKPKAWEVSDEVTNTTLMDEVIERVNKGEAFGDYHVLGVFNAMKKQGYFSTITFVDSKALRELLYALSCPEQPHLIREIQATRGLPSVEGQPRNPIDQLIVDEQQGKQNADT